MTPAQRAAGWVLRQYWPEPPNTPQDALVAAAILKEELVDPEPKNCAVCGSLELDGEASGMLHKRMTRDALCWRCLLWTLKYEEWDTDRELKSRLPGLIYFTAQMDTPEDSIRSIAEESLVTDPMITRLLSLKGIRKDSSPGGAGR